MTVFPILFALKPMHVLIGVAMATTAVFLILLVLVQRGRGGGLAGAFGGMGGQSAFGTKAGDTFTRVTIVVATVWILLCILGIKILSPPNNSPPAADAGQSGAVGSPAEGEGDDGADSSEAGTSGADLTGDLGTDPDASSADADTDDAAGETGTTDE